VGALTDHQRAPVGTLTAGAKLDRYEILAKLASGGMATVYVARAQGVAGFERLVAIKVLHANLAHDEEFISMFLDEARLAASIRHANVVGTLDVSGALELGGAYFIVMEYIEGDHLGGLLSNAQKTGEKLPVPTSLRIIVDALAGLGAAHSLRDDTGKSLNLVHRDVSPHNILVGVDGVVRLTDFGVAKAEDRLTHTREGQVKGKLAYMAPEQATGVATDARSDLFSVGIILWECLSGQRLFRADTTAATLYKLLHQKIPKPSSFDSALEPLDGVLARALHRDPAERFSSAEAFARAIEDLAPVVGGLAPLRGVSRTVRHYAGQKLEREKRLIDDALRALRPDATAQHALTQEAEPVEELTGPDEISSEEISIDIDIEDFSSSKISGVFAHNTMTDEPWSRREDDSESLAVELTPDELEATANERLRKRVLPQSSASVVIPQDSPKRDWLFTIAAAILAAAGAYYVSLKYEAIGAWLSQERTATLSPDPAARRLGIEAVAPVTTPAAETVHHMAGHSELGSAADPSDGGAKPPLLRGSGAIPRESNKTAVATRPFARHARAKHPRKTPRVRPAPEVQPQLSAPDIIPNPYHD